MSGGRTRGGLLSGQEGHMRKKAVPPKLSTLSAHSPLRSHPVVILPFIFRTQRPTVRPIDV